ncbi:MAG: hypothetical protein PHP79_02470, partial [Clostridia bacterium]|nr:hypothetical protein [Clostridia bacterium]
MKKHFKRWNLPESRIYLAIILFFVLILFQFDYWIGGMALALFLVLVLYDWRIIGQRKEEWNSYLENLSEDMDWAAKNAVLSIPMPLVVIGSEGIITWYNPQFRQLMEGKKRLDRSIQEFIPQFPISKLKDEQEGTINELNFNERWYRLLWSTARTDSINPKDKVIYLVYWLDITEDHHIKTLYQAKKVVFAHIVVDNYDEVISHTESIKRPAVLAEIESRIARWAKEINAGWLKHDHEKYLVVMEEQELENTRQKKFQVLDNIRDISLGNKIPVTLSIGVGQGAETPALAFSSALSALELALGRGGDQAVVKQGTKLFFYGGRSQGVEKRTKVKSRVIANALRELIEHSAEVFIMSHEGPDLDSIGASLGIYRCARFAGKNAYIVLDKSNAAVDALIKKLQEK